MFCVQAEHAGTRTYFFSADSPQEQEEWIRAMGDAAQVAVQPAQRYAPLTPHSCYSRPITQRYAPVTQRQRSITELQQIHHRATAGHHRATAGHPRATATHHRATAGHHRAAAGHHRATATHHRATATHHRATAGHHRATAGHHRATAGHHMLKLVQGIVLATYLHWYHFNKQQINKHPSASLELIHSQ